MFEIRQEDRGLIRLAGRFDASQVEKAQEVLNAIETSTIVDFGELDYISSAGLGALFAVQKRLSTKQDGLTLRDLNPHIREVFRLAGFDTIFAIE